MECASRDYCCVVHPAGGRDATVKTLWSEAMGREYGGELDSDLDDLVYVILRERGILVNVKVVDLTDKVSVEQEARHIESLMKRYVKMNLAFRERIRKRVLEKSKNGVLRRESHAAVMWWKAPAL